MPAKTTQPSEDVNNPYGYSDMDWAAQLDPAYASSTHGQLSDIRGIGEVAVPHRLRRDPRL